jgi:hypothetical protein
VTNKESVEKLSTYGSTEIYALIKGLKKFTDYSVQVCGFTSKGCGKTAEGPVKTHEDGKLSYE